MRNETVKADQMTAKERFRAFFDTDQAALQAVEQGSLDIAVVHPPFYKLAADSGLTLIGDSSDSGLGEAAGLYLYYFTDDYIKKTRIRSIASLG
jgi:hypothetical protein